MQISKWRRALTSWITCGTQKNCLQVIIKVRIFNPNVKIILLWGTETWRTITNTVKMFKYLWTIVYTRNSISFDRISSATTYCGRERTSLQLERKWKKDDGGGWDIHFRNQQTVSRVRPWLEILTVNGKVQDQGSELGIGVIKGVNRKWKQPERNTLDRGYRRAKQTCYRIKWEILGEKKPIAFS